MTVKVGDEIVGTTGVIKNKKGTVKSINKDMAQVDFGNGNIYGISLRRIQNGKITEDRIIIKEEFQIPGTNIILEKGDKIEIQEANDTFNYQMLGRLKQDCIYSIQNKHIKHLWGITVKDHIAEMRRLYNLLSVKPQGLTMKDIDNYEIQLNKIR